MTTVILPGGDTDIQYSLFLYLIITIRINIFFEIFFSSSLIIFLINLRGSRAANPRRGNTARRTWPHLGESAALTCEPILDFVTDEMKNLIPT